jgi:hypothetical protein
LASVERGKNLIQPTNNGANDDGTGETTETVNGLPIPWLPLIMDRYLMDRKGIGIRKNGIERIIRVRDKKQRKITPQRKTYEEKKYRKSYPSQSAL